MNTGVYTITCTVTGDVYVGAALKCFWTRWEWHIGTLRKGQHGNARLQADWNRYGEDTFRFKEVEECCGKSECLKAEKKHIDKLRSEGIGLYNKSRRYRSRYMVECAKNLTAEQLKALCRLLE